MSRLSGRLSFPNNSCQNDERNKRLFAGMLGHLDKNEQSPKYDARKVCGESDERKVQDRSFPNHGRRRGNRGRGRGGRSSMNQGNPSRNSNFEGTSALADEKRIPSDSQRNSVHEDMPFEELLDVDEIISQIGDLNIRGDRSAAQIKRNITHNQELLESLDEEEWQKICECLLDTVFEQGESDFVVDLFISLIKNESFSNEMSSLLMSISSTHIMTDNSRPVPVLLASILCAHWPRHISKAIDTVNLILYTTACIIKGWIQVIEEDNVQFISNDNKDQDESVEQEDPEIVNRCAVALSELCETAQRQLWLKWPTITDEIYVAIKPAITHNSNLTGDTKSRLLSAYTKINTWTNSRAVTTKNCQTQTIGC